MPEIVTCPQCNRKLKVPDTLLGKTVKCPTCNTTFTAEAAGGAAVQSNPPQDQFRDEPPPREPAPRRRPADDYDDDRDRPRRRGGNLTPHRGSMIMVLGILSLFVAPFILGPIAWIMGNGDLKEIRAGRMDPEGESNTNTGRICGMIATIGYGAFFLLCCGFYLIVVIIGLAAGGTNTGSGFQP